MDLLNLFNYQVWIKINPGPLLPGSFRILAIIFGAFLVGAIISKKISRFESIDKTKKIAWKKVYSMLAWMGILGLIYLFFASEGIAILGMRVWFLVWIAGVVVWTVFIIRYIFIEIPAKEKSKSNRQHFEKYLPKKKKR